MVERRSMGEPKDPKKEYTEQNIAHVRDIFARIQSATDDETRDIAATELVSFVIEHVADPNDVEKLIEENVRNKEELRRLFTDRDGYIYVGSSSSGTRIRFSNTDRKYYEKEDGKISWMYYPKPRISEDRHEDESRYMPYYQKFVDTFGTDYVDLRPDIPLEG